MNREMADHVDKAKSEAAARSYTGSTQRSSSLGAKRTKVTGDAQERAVQAGWILQRFLHLSALHRLILTIKVMRPRQTCSCGSPCCRGWIVKTRWVEAVRLVCEHLKLHAELLKEPGKRGMSSDPRLRQLLVEEYAKPEERRMSLTDMQSMLEITTTTIAKHRFLIYEHLEALENQAWTDLAAIFDAAGITGEIH